MSKEELEKLEREKYVVERKLTAAMHKEKRLQSELKRLTRSERTHRLCTRAGMLETFLKEPTTLTDDDVMELLPSKEAAMKIADDFGISYDSRQKPSIRPKIREPTPEQKYQQEENHCYKVLSDYFHLLRKWEKQYAPQRTDEVWHPLFVEALEKKSYIEYLLDILLYDTPEEKKALVAEQRKEVMKLEQRIAGHTAEHDRGRSQRKSGLDR